MTNYDDRRSRPSRALSLRRLVLLTIGAYFCAGLALWSQTSDSQTGDANKSWTATSDAHKANSDPVRTVESHSQSGNRSVDKQSVERLGADGHYEPFQDIEKETVQVDAGTVRTITRTFNRDADGAKTLVEVTDEEKRTSAGGDSNVVRSTSHPDVNGSLQLIRRQIDETKNISQNVEETKTTVMVPGANGGLDPIAKQQERREWGANGAVDSQKTTLVPDASGNWQVGEIRRVTTTQQGENRSTEERVSVPDSEGKIGEVSRTVTKEEAGGSGEKRNTVETYSTAIPGAVGDGTLHLIERATTAERTSSTGQQTTGEQVEKINPGQPADGLQVTILTNDTVLKDPGGAQGIRTVRERDANGNFGVISVDTTKSDNSHTVQVQIAPATKPK
jgi:hypothetical protein